MPRSGPGSYGLVVCSFHVCGVLLLLASCVFVCSGPEAFPVSGLVVRRVHGLVVIILPYNTKH